VLVTHAHTDHMDPETLGPLFQRFPDLPFIVPAARMEIAQQRIGTSAQLIGMDARQDTSPVAGLTVTGFAAAHETLEQDASGQHLFLGYGVVSGGIRLYHSGDCIPYPGLAEALRAFQPHLALLPVNGRDAARLAAGVPGNFTLDEAIALTKEACVPALIAHHFGLFDFNTLDPEEIDRAAEKTDGAPLVLRPRAGERFNLLV